MFAYLVNSQQRELEMLTGRLWTVGIEPTAFLI